jgi:hypothetical protein
MEIVIPGATNIGLFIGAALVLLLIPGPAVLYIVARSVAQGRMAVSGVTMARPWRPSPWGSVRSPSSPTTALRAAAPEAPTSVSVSVSVSGSRAAYFGGKRSAPSRRMFSPLR